MKILVTGASGMLGRNIVDTFQVTSHALYTPSRADLDLFHAQSVLKYVDKIQPDLIIHCAGKVGGILANIDNPLGFYLENLDVGRNIVLAARNVEVPKLINMGSSCMYPRDASNPLKEDEILRGELEPTNEGYALAKISIQKLCSYIAAENYSLQYKTLIPCNLFGLYDKFDYKNAHLIPSVIRKIYEVFINNGSEVVIWGDGTARREFMFASNVADFLLNKIDTYVEWPAVMNLGAGVDYSVLEYYTIIANLIGFKGNFTFDLSKPAGMKQKLVDITRQTALGWTPPISLEVGINKTFEYYLRNFKDNLLT